MAASKIVKPFHDFIAEVEKSPAFTNSHHNCELILDDNDGALGLHKILEIKIKDYDKENITVGVNEEDNQSEANLADAESLSDGISNENINQEIINYVYDNLIAKEVNNESSSNNLDPNDKVVKNLRATSKNEQLDDNDKNKSSSSTTVEETHEENPTIIKKNEDKLSLQSPVFVEGKCFISDNSIYFVSAFNQILNNSSIVRVTYESLLSIKKAQEMDIIPEWFKIKPDENQSFAFTALLDKDDTHDSISNMIEYAMDSKQKLETNTAAHDQTETTNQKTNLDSNDIESSHDLSENVLITKDADEMISMSLYPEEIALLEENEFFSDLHHAISLYVNKDFKEVYKSIFSKIHPRNPFYDFYQRAGQRGADYSKFDVIPDDIQVPSAYSVNLKYNIGLEKAKKRIYGSFALPSRADINENVKLFFFNSCIVLQTQINFESSYSFLNSFRAVITAVIHDVPSEDGSGKNTTQIDMLYGAYFLDSSFFKKLAKKAVLPILKIICTKFKTCMSECLRDVYKEKSFRERGIEVKDINAIFRKYPNNNGPRSNAPRSSNLHSRSSSVSSINSIGSISSISSIGSDNGDTRNRLINEISREPDAENKTLTGFKNQITNPKNNKMLIKIKNIENIITKYLSEAMHMNHKVTPSDKSKLNIPFINIVYRTTSYFPTYINTLCLFLPFIAPIFSAKSIAILMYIYMNFIQGMSNSS
ncbi:conserved Plasmodium protein, unknown function [Plasmodium chabaudi chabaudi]|uniref:PC10116w n=1 Tax=Plasmodium chabaudi chabaudi TaxID=31271 RepID=Q7YZ75_PLACU|nr:conserved Plasmodium protein, unknown function [Plasmodium chabaudi chabaudi]AAO06141.1 PC10116w [Plasmodium chabaudi chabaudi]VTZ68212.1 conserved Plasmodium protein, unknown function [Plasmodium chabaudi chabaudi]|eukprot:XP_016653702.1 conserved Plasmodium protein, unknown function [Plasmodium chabaudi chabaudi]